MDLVGSEASYTFDAGDLPSGFHYSQVVVTKGGVVVTSEVFLIAAPSSPAS